MSSEARQKALACGVIALFVAGCSPSVSKRPIEDASPICALTRCGDDCADIDEDPAHCGGCGIRCDEGHGCVNGACSPCRLDAIMCFDALGALVCIPDPDRNTSHCGACDNRCDEGHACVEGECAPCPTNQIACANATGDVTCVDDLESEIDHCGACGYACEANRECVEGECKILCAAPLARCGDEGPGFCVDHADDRAHCGACGIACEDDQACASGRCTTVCDPSLTHCEDEGPGYCTDLQVDADNCGACGTPCPLDTTGVCAGGGCTLCTPSLETLSTNPPSIPSGLFKLCSPCTVVRCGSLTTWALESSGHPWPPYFELVSYGPTGAVVRRERQNGARYVDQITLDAFDETVSFSGQGPGATVPFDRFRLP